jgi:hypothetical protein
MAPDQVSLALHGRVLRSNGPRVMVLEHVSTAALRLLYLSTRGFQCFWPAKMGKDFPNDVAIPRDAIKLGTFASTRALSALSCSTVSSCSISQQRAKDRMAALAEAVVDVIGPGLHAACA